MILKIVLHFIPQDSQQPLKHGILFDYCFIFIYYYYGIYMVLQRIPWHYDVMMECFCLWKKNFNYKFY